MIRTILIDDEAPARDELRYLLTTNHSDVIDIIGEADNATAAISLITREKPALIFLDIHMRGLSGLELAQVIHDISPDSKIIFATAYDEYALKAFELQALDYVVKPMKMTVWLKRFSMCKNWWEPPAIRSHTAPEPPVTQPQVMVQPLTMQPLTMLHQLRPPEPKVLPKLSA